MATARVGQRQRPSFLECLQIFPAEIVEPGFLDAVQPLDGALTHFRAGLDCPRLNQDLVGKQGHDALGHLPVMRHLRQQTQHVLDRLAGLAVFVKET